MTPRRHCKHVRTGQCASEGRAQACGGIRGGPRRRSASSPAGSAARAAVAVVSVLRWLGAHRGLRICVTPPLPAVSGCSSQRPTFGPAAPALFRRSVPISNPGPRAAAAGPRLARCSRTRSRVASFPSSTASAASPCRSGTKSTTYITCPADPKKTLGIKLPFLVMIIKNLKKYFTFEVQVLDDKNVRRRFRASNYQSTTRVKPFICTMPMRLDDGWNQIQFNLSDFTRRAYGTNYIETLRVQIHANCRIRRVYFSDRLYSEDELPAEFKLYLPVQNKAKQ
ncbi:cilia- and flagella-associated protein 20 isoform X1 [Mus musculus]|uniref:cilia- and flagella-associated protein 20 isoform X1 n=1 Tax=Mus musculus TaxID=10090 RepID=UPI00167C4208|nr:cilia- and flagella-associated protein 20 isoform X1 [Mus musculus]